MVELLSASVLSDDEKTLISTLSGKIRAQERPLTILDRYYDGAQRLEHIGLAVPEELRHFEVVVGIPALAVDEPTIRQRVRRFYRSGDSTKSDPALQEAWEFNNLASESDVTHQEMKVFGRTVVTVGTNADDPEHPLITTEDPRQIGFSVDPRNRRFTALFRMFRDEDAKVTRGTLMTPDSTVHVVRGQRGWVVDGGDGYGRDDHGLGVVPAVLFANRRRGSSWLGRSEMTPVIGMTDAIARMVTNMQVGAETHALPSWFISGASKEDFVDRDGKPIPVWESYFTAIKALANADARVQNIAPGDLENFTDAVNNLLAWCASVLGLPTRYAGQQSVNPAAEGAIRADESRLVGRTDRMNRHAGDCWAWVMGLEERFRTGEWGERNSIRTLWFDPGTQAYSQLADGVVKLRQVGALSVEGMWDELGWDEARKTLERSRLDAEATTDPVINAARALGVGDAGSGS